MFLGMKIFRVGRRKSRLRGSGSFERTHYLLRCAGAVPRVEEPFQIALKGACTPDTRAPGHRLHFAAVGLESHYIVMSWPLL